jgi:hypothetical protein
VRECAGMSLESGVWPDWRLGTCSIPKVALGESVLIGCRKASPEAAEAVHRTR